MYATIPDLLRLLAVPVLGWAAWSDIRTRRVPNETWLPLAALGVVLLLWEGFQAATGAAPGFFLRVAISIGFLVPLVTAFWWMGSFGGADAKAFYVVALLFPTYPVYYLAAPLPAVTLPLEPTPVGVFSLTILSNTVLVGAVYPLAVALGNLLRGHVGLPMVIGKPVAVDGITDEYGILLETPEGYTRRGLDLDALRMYLQWRGTTLSALRGDPEGHRDPASLPAEPNPPGDGGIATDGGDEVRSASESANASDALPADADDQWGAEAFLADVEGNAYGTTPERLREGLTVLADEEVVWVSPGIPFIVPMFVGLLVSLLYGDVLFTAIAALGAV